MKIVRWCAALMAVAPLWSGIRIKSEVTDLKTNETTHQEMLLDADRMRINITGKGAGTSVLFLTDGGRNRMVMLDKERNEYREIDQQMMSQMSQQMQGAMAQMQSQMQNMPPEARARMEELMRGRGMTMPGAAPAAPARTTYTAKGAATVNGFTCTNYEGMRGADKVAEVCAAKPGDLRYALTDFQVFEKMREFTASLTSAFQNSPLASMRFSDYAERGFDGFPVLRTTFANGQPANKSEVKSIERAGFSDADFSLGTAKKLDMPMMGGRGGR